MSTSGQQMDDHSFEELLEQLNNTARDKDRLRLIKSRVSEFTGDTTLSAKQIFQVTQTCLMGEAQIEAAVLLFPICSQGMEDFEKSCIDKFPYKSDKDDIRKGIGAE